jgi:hypothetical protein
MTIIAAAVAIATTAAIRLDDTASESQQSAGKNNNHSQFHDRLQMARDAARTRCFKCR